MTEVFIFSLRLEVVQRKSVPENIYFLNVNTRTVVFASYFRRRKLLSTCRKYVRPLAGFVHIHGDYGPLNVRPLSKVVVET